MSGYYLRHYKLASIVGKIAMKVLGKFCDMGQHCDTIWTQTDEMSSCFDTYIIQKLLSKRLLLPLQFH